MLLLDTCIVYDWLMGELRDEGVIKTVRREGARVSAVVVWEMAIKHALGKLPLPTTDLVTEVEAHGFDWLAIEPRHAQAVLTMPAHHRDPFDRLLIAQANVEEMRVVTYDTVFCAYRADTWIARG